MLLAQDSRDFLEDVVFVVPFCDFYRCNQHRSTKFLCLTLTLNHA